jgi:oligopeptide transport system substrate-binding protein
MKATKFPFACAVLTAATLFQIPSFARADEPIQILIDGVEQRYDAPPVVKNDRTLVPLRGILESLGGTVYWNEYSHEIDVKKGDRIITLRIGDKVATVDGKETSLDQPPEILSDRTMVPLRFLAESVGADVQWDGDHNAVVIKTTASQPQKKVFNGLFQPGVRSDLEADNKNEFHQMVVRQVLEGLLRLDANGQPTAGVAKSWKVSPDGLTYTFTLRDDAKWSDGSTVTAQDFVRGIQDALKLDSPAKQWVLLLKNGIEILKGEKTKDQIGVRASDDHTLELSLVHSNPNFTDLLTREAFYPKKIAANGKNLSNGAFVPTGITDQRAVGFLKNPYYWDREHVLLDKAHILYVTGYKNDGVDDLYRLGFADRMYIPQPFYNAYKNNADRVLDALYDVSYLSFNSKNKALQNKKIRQALAYALDNEAIAASFESGVNRPAHRMQAPGMDAVDIDLLQQKQNAPRAKQLLAEGLKEAGLNSLPTLTLTVWDGSDQVQAAKLLQQQWKQNLGVEIAVKKLPQLQQMENAFSKDFDIAWLNRPAESKENVVYLGVYISNSPYNEAGYANPQFDDLISRANHAEDATMRAKLIRDAEAMLLQDAAIVPLTHTQLLALQKPYVKGFTLYPTLPAFDLKYVSVEGK